MGQTVTGGFMIAPTRKTHSLKTKGNKMKKQVKITWNSTRSESASATFELPEKSNQIKTNEVLMDCIYAATNLKSELADFGYSAAFIELWNAIEKVLPANRSHTSLSIGDTIQINHSTTSIELQDGPTYKVANVGFTLLEKVGA